MIGTLSLVNILKWWPFLLSNGQFTKKIRVLQGTDERMLDEYRGKHMLLKD